MRLLYIHRGYFPLLAGAEMMVYNVAREMRQRGHQVLVISQSVCEDIEQRIIDGADILGIPQAEDVPGIQALLPWQPDIVHVVDAVWPEYVRLAHELAQRLHVPWAVTPASAISVWQEAEKTLAMCQTADLICVLTQSEQDLFAAQSIARERFVIIGQGPHLKGNPDPVTFRQKYGIRGHMILFLGRKIAFKGYQHLLRATAQVWDRQPDAFFVFIGPRYDANCLQLFQSFKDKRVIELDMVDDGTKYSALTACDLVCLPTSADVFPLVFIEAWACGKAVITSPFPGVGEIVHNGKDGLIVTAEPDALAAAILHLLEDPEYRLTLGNAGRARVQSHFNWHSVTNRIEAAYVSLLANKPGNIA